MLLLLRIRYLSYNTLKCMAGVALFYSFLLLLYCLFCQTSFFRGIPFLFRSEPRNGLLRLRDTRNSAKGAAFPRNNKSCFDFRSIPRNVLDRISMATLYWANGENDVRAHLVIYGNDFRAIWVNAEISKHGIFQFVLQVSGSMLYVRLMQLTDQK